jgi:hypothetical protein
MFDAFVQLAPSISTKYSGLFEKWHASVHFKLSSHAQLWIRFKVQPQQKANLLQVVQNDLSQFASSMGFQIKNVLVQTEGQTFGEGDPRPGYDVFSSVGGSAGMPALWQQIQTATEWAAADLLNGTTRQPPLQWFPWARHIYENLNP